MHLRKFPPGRQRLATVVRSSYLNRASTRRANRHNRHPPGSARHFRGETALSTISYTTDTDLSIAFVSWINQELRKEIERREEFDDEPLFATRMKGFLASALSAITVGLARLIHG